MLILDGIIEFITVAETHSFTKAANKLNTSVAQISRRVSALEKRLAIKLFHRNTRKVILSQSGEIYYRQCKQHIDGLAQAELALTQMQLAPTGLLKITAPVTYGEMTLAPLLHQFIAQYPELDLELNLTNQKLDLIEHGIDIAIRLGRLQDCNLIAKSLSTRQLYVCASLNYLKKYGKPQIPDDLHQHSCLIGNDDLWHFKQNNKEKSVKISGRIKCNSGFALVDAANRSLGLVQLPDYYLQEALDTGQLIEVLLPYRANREGIWALYPPNKHLSLKVKLLLEFLDKHIRNS